MKQHIAPFKLILIGITAVLITAAAIVFPGNGYRILPLYVSLVVMLLQTNANRFCFLLGGINSVTYSVVYFSLGLYGNALYALLFSCPIQIVTFLRWKKQAYAQATVLRRLTGKQRILWGIGFAVVWLILYFALSSAGSNYLILDNTISVIGIAGSIFSMLSLMEFPYLSAAGTVLSVILYAAMLRENPAQLTYLIFNLYAMICNILSANYTHKLYQKQQQEGLNTP